MDLIEMLLEDQQPAFLGSVTLRQMDVLLADTGVICHGVNCQGKMKSGVAKFIREKWPSVYTTYSDFIRSNGTGGHLLGKVDISLIRDEQLYVANCFTQEFYGYDGKVYADAGAIVEALATAFDFANSRGLPVYVPHIGGKRGGLDFYKDVLPSIYALAEEYSVHVIVCEFDKG